MSRKTLSIFTMTLVVMVLLAGCDAEPEQSRTVMTVSLNDNMSLICDTYEQGQDLFDDVTGLAITDDDFIRPEMIALEFFNRPYNTMIVTDAGYPHGDFLVTGYRVVWESLTDGVDPLPTYNGGLGIHVPSGEFVEGALTLVTFENKATPPLSDTQYANIEIAMNAHITFYGHELGTDREISFEGTLGVIFADMIQKTK